MIVASPQRVEEVSPSSKIYDPRNVLCDEG